MKNVDMLVTVHDCIKAYWGEYRLTATFDTVSPQNIASFLHGFDTNIINDDEFESITNGQSVWHPINPKNENFHKAIKIGFIEKAKLSSVKNVEVHIKLR